MKLINKKNIICSLALLLLPISLMGASTERLSVDQQVKSVQLAHNGWHGGYYRAGWHDRHYHRGGGRWIGGVWYSPGVYYTNCRNVQVYQKTCSPVCYWDYGYGAERCRNRCFSQPYWVKRCW